jgi:hypothetical protein
MNLINQLHKKVPNCIQAGWAVVTIGIVASAFLPLAFKVSPNQDFEAIPCLVSSAHLGAFGFS